MPLKGNENNFQLKIEPRSSKADQERIAIGVAGRVVGLTGVTNQQYVTIAVTNVASADGGTGSNGSARVGFLAGHVNASRVETVGDLGLVNAQLAQPVNAANFLKGVNAS